MQYLEGFIDNDNLVMVVVSFEEKEFHLTVYKTTDSGSGL
jgi:hypothetical protein